MIYEDVTVVEIAAGPWFREEEGLFPEEITEIYYVEGLEDEEDPYLVWIYVDEELDEKLDYEMNIAQPCKVVVDGMTVEVEEPEEYDDEFWFKF